MFLPIVGSSDLTLQAINVNRMKYGSQRLIIRASIPYLKITRDIKRLFHDSKSLNSRTYVDANTCEIFAALTASRNRAKISLDFYKS